MSHELRIASPANKPFRVIAGAFPRATPGIAAHVGFGANLSYEHQTLSGQGTLVSGSYFPVLGVQPALASVPAAGILVAATYWRAPELLRRIRMPWLTVLGICVLFVVINAAAITPERMERLNRTARKHSAATFDRELLRAHTIDRMIKGVETGDPWDSVLELALAISLAAFPKYSCDAACTPYAPRPK